jgi:hypothetical protein
MLYAAADRGPGRHVLNLKDLRSSPEELLEVSRWTRQHDPSEGFHFVLKDFA